MIGMRFIQSVFGASILIAAHTAANAAPTTFTAVYGVINAGTTYEYYTSSTVPAAAGSLHFNDASNSYGGLCEPGLSPCPTSGTLAPGATQGQLISQKDGSSGGTYGVTEGGIIGIYTPSTPSNYSMSILITNKNSGKGDIYDLVVNGSSIGTTPIVSSTASFVSFTFNPTINGANQLVTISVTDLLQQYGGISPYNLPSDLGGSSALDSSSATAPPLSLFTIDVTFVATPEPASLSIFGVGTLVLTFARKRLRGANVRNAV
jgi:hypothetical protein